MPLPTLTNYQTQPGFTWTGPVAEHSNFHSFVMDPKPVHLKVEDYLSGDPFFDVIDEEDGR
jgi:hypothetical protein